MLNLVRVICTKAKVLLTDMLCFYAVICGIFFITVSKKLLNIPLLTWHPQGKVLHVGMD